MEFLTEAVNTAHCEEHGNWRAESKEVTWSEDQPWIAHHWDSGTTATYDEVYGGVGCGSQQRITDTKQRISGSIQQINAVSD